MSQLIPKEKFTRQVKSALGDGDNLCLEIGWKPSTSVFVSVRKCLGHRPKDPVGRFIEFEFDPNSQPSAPEIQSFRFT